MVELTGDLPTISFRDVKIQRRENDLVAGSFGRGIYILDDYSPLRTVSEKALKQEALLFTSRDALWYIPDSMHTDSQGDFEYRAKNPDFGATFTYYLRDGIKSPKQDREDKEKKNIEKGKYPLYPEWKSIDAELREVEPTVYLIIKNKQGDIIRKVKANAKKGIHRVTWDLRFPSANALGTRPGFFGDSGPLVTPGEYSVSLYTTASGKTTMLASGVNFNVKPLHQKNEAGNVSPEERTQLILEVESLRRHVSAANSQVKELKDQLKSIRTAMDRSTAVTSDLENQYQQLREAVFTAEEILNGQPSRSGMGSVPASVSGRLFMIEFARANTWGITNTQKQQMGFVKDALGLLQPTLKNLMQNEFPALKEALFNAGAPWIPSGPVKEKSDKID
ncbi:MAG: hypothetical protein JKY19_06890 [Alcanivoracaceae bacterium]|nr:hypothetical protein [Alcanivoracaceae bacterium]